MSGVKDYKLELTDFEEVVLKIKIKEIAKNLKSRNMPLKEISEITKLSIEEIEKL